MNALTLTMIPASEAPFAQGKSIEQAIQEGMTTWFVDGSCYYKDGKPKTSYVAIQITDKKVIQVQRVCTLHKQLKWWP